MTQDQNSTNQRPEQTLSLDNSRESLDKTNNDKARYVVLRLSQTYGHLFTSNFKTDAMFEMAVDEWEESIGHYPIEKLKKAIFRCKQEHKKTVTLPQFMDCLKITPMQAINFDKPKGIEYQESDEKRKARFTKGEVHIKNMIDGLGIVNKKPIKKVKPLPEYNEQELLSELGGE